ncbi:MAG: zf-HC2 domain-containing protein [Candidatus Rokubacteria bacterium]|nr:zf-HC2 domain-containing protein [Candidatus Rokubacteria bacterium]
MECRELFARLSEYLDGEITPEVCEALRRHVEGCERCDAFLDTLRFTVDVCRCLPPPPLPDDLRRRLHQLIENPPPA